MCVSVCVCLCMCVSLLDRSLFTIVYVCWRLILVSPMVISGASTLQIFINTSNNHRLGSAGEGYA